MTVLLRLAAASVAGLILGAVVWAAAPSFADSQVPVTLPDGRLVQPPGWHTAEPACGTGVGS